MYVIIGVRKGVIEEVRATDSEGKATEIEKEVCDAFSVPFEGGKREKYYKNHLEPNEVRRFSISKE